MDHEHALVELGRSLINGVCLVEELPEQVLRVFGDTAQLFDHAGQ